MTAEGHAPRCGGTGGCSAAPAAGTEGYCSIYKMLERKRPDGGFPAGSNAFVNSLAYFNIPFVESPVFRAKNAKKHPLFSWKITDKMHNGPFRAPKPPIRREAASKGPKEGRV